MKVKVSLLAITAIASVQAMYATAQTNNEILGTEAGASLTSGDNNTLIGDYAGRLVSSGSTNTFIGQQAGYSSSTGTEGVFVGHQAGYSNTTGGDNTFIGTQAGYSNTGTDNTFIGTQAGYHNTSGFDNTFLGEQAGYYTTTGGDNTFVGEDAGYANTTGKDNTAVGSWALRSNITGNYNTAVGSEAGYDIGTRETIGIAVRNTMVGTSAGTDIGSGVANTMIGDNAGPNTEYAHFNTFVGFQAGFDNNRTNNLNDANRNTAVGAYAGYINREGEDNVWLGALADSGRRNFNQTAEVSYLRGTTAPQWDPGFTNSGISNSDNTIYRTTVLGANASGEDNDVVTIGYYSRAAGTGTIAIGSTTTATHTGSIVIGYQSASQANNTVTIGRSDTVSWNPHTDAVTELGTSTYRFENVHSNKVSVNAATGNAATIDLHADAAAQDDDKWSISAANSGNLTIASESTGSAVNLLTLDNSGNATFAGNLNLNSDGRLKDNIQTIGNAMALVKQLVGSSYNWKEGLGRQLEKQYGFVAQNVEAILPELVSERDGVKSVNYIGIMPVMLNALKEQDVTIKAQSKTIEEQRKRIEQLEALQAQMQLAQKQIDQLRMAMKTEMKTELKTASNEN